MSPASAFIDTNLLVLLIVGSLDRELIRKHKRTRNFVPEDYDRLIELADVLQVFVTPNTLTETSNLLNVSQNIKLMKQINTFIQQVIEIYVPSKEAAKNQKFNSLGLTDVVLLASISEERPLITVDFDLYGAALAKGDKLAYNFTHWQEW